jgi:hypothetical protein
VYDPIRKHPGFQYFEGKDLPYGLTPLMLKVAIADCKTHKLIPEKAIGWNWSQFKNQLTSPDRSGNRIQAQNIRTFIQKVQDYAPNGLLQDLLKSYNALDLILAKTTTSPLFDSVRRHEGFRFFNGDDLPHGLTPDMIRVAMAKSGAHYLLPTGGTSWKWAMFKGQLERPKPAHVPAIQKFIAKVKEHASSARAQ